MRSLLFLPLVLMLAAPAFGQQPPRTGTRPAAPPPAAAPAPAPAEDLKPWITSTPFVSPIDDRRSFDVSAERGDLTLRLGCRLDRPLVRVVFSRLLLPNRDKITGAYRLDQKPPVVVAWSGEDGTSWSLDVPEAKAALEGLFAARLFHIRIGELERTIPLAGLAALSTRYREACRPS